MKAAEMRRTATTFEPVQCLPMPWVEPCQEVLPQAKQNIGLSLYEMLSMAELARVAYEKGEIASLQGRLSLLIVEAEDLAVSVAGLLKETELETKVEACTRCAIDLSSLLHEVSETGRSITGDKPIAIEVSLPSDAAYMYADPVKVRWILMALVSNAAKFTDRGRIALIAGKDSSEATFTIADTGRGMTQAQINMLHVPDTQNADNGVNNTYTSGLGLRTVRAFVNQLHGRISLSSQLGKGTIVTIHLPAQ